MVVLAKILKNDFDLEDLVSKVKTTTTKNIKKGLDSSKGGFRINKNTGGSGGALKNIADYF
jgi:hypothetical protein